MRPIRIFILATALTSAHAADVCNPADFQGPYGFQLSGTATIGLRPQPVVSVGRLVFDGQGSVTGVSSVSFTGLYLGNPITGKYEAHDDCSVSWSLQDDSGNFQHFQGTMTSDALRVQFHQTDPVGSSRGTLVKAAEKCQDSDFQKRYRYSVSGKRIDVDAGEVTGSVSASGVLEASGGQLTLTPATDSAMPGSGTVQVGDDCFVQLHLSSPAEMLDMNFRGILVDQGRQLLGMATDPGTSVSLRLTAP